MTYVMNLKHLKAQIKHGPDDYKNYIKLAEFHLNSNDILKAISAFQKAVKVKPDLPDVYFNLGTLFQLAFELERAVKNYEKAIEYKPDLPSAYSEAGFCCYNLKEFEKSETYLKKAIELDENDCDARIYSAQLYLTLMRTEEALKEAEFVYGKNNEDIDAINILATCFFLKGEIRQAEIYWKDCLQINKEFTDAYVGLGQILLLLERTDDAEVLLKRALMIDEESFEVYSGLGSVYLAKKDFEKAGFCFNKSIELNPEFTDAYSGLIRCLINTNNLDEAEDLCRALLKDNQDNVNVQILLSEILGEKEQFEELIEQHKKILVLKPDHTPSLFYLGSIFYEGNIDKELGKSMLEKIIEIDEKSEYSEDVNKILRIP